MYKKIIITIIAIVSVVFLWALVRGPKDTWICENGQWVKHGAPSAPMPSESCGEESVAGTMDAKLCSDGSYVSRVLPECDFALCSKENLIQVESPRPNEIISSPLTIKGKARGFWFFEASFPVKLLDSDGNLLAQAIAQAQGDPSQEDEAGWMTEDFVPFFATLNFEAPATNQGLLILEKDNPPGLPENVDELQIPVAFEIEFKTIKLFYYNSELDKDETGNVRCSRDGLVAVEREVLISQTPIQDSIRLLLLGELTAEERAQGIETEYPLEGLSLKGATLKDGVLTVEFADSKSKTVGGSCRVGILWFQIEATAKQFPEVRQVRFWPEEIFQP